MRKTYTSVPRGNSVLHRVVILDDLSEGPAVVQRQFLFLQDVVNNGMFSGLLSCGPLPFQTFTMRHDGRQWCIIMEAVEEKT